LSHIDVARKDRHAIAPVWTLDLVRRPTTMASHHIDGQRSDPHRLSAAVARAVDSDASSASSSCNHLRVSQQTRTPRDTRSCHTCAHSQRWSRRAFRTRRRPHRPHRHSPRRHYLPRRLLRVGRWPNRSNHPTHNPRSSRFPRCHAAGQRLFFCGSTRSLHAFSLSSSLAPSPPWFPCRYHSIFHRH